MPGASDGRVDAIRDLGPLRLRSFRDRDTHTIALAGELHRESLDGLERELERVENTDAGVIMLDLRELEFIDPSGLQVIVMAHRRAAGRRVVAEGSQPVQRVFRIRDVRSRRSSGRRPFFESRPARTLVEK